MPKAKEPGPIASHWLNMEDLFRSKGRTDMEIAIFRLAFYHGAQFVLNNGRTAMSLLIMASEVREFEHECGVEEIRTNSNEVHVS